MCDIIVCQSRGKASTRGVSGVSGGQHIRASLVDGLVDLPFSLHLTYNTRSPLVSSSPRSPLRLLQTHQSSSLRRIQASATSQPHSPPATRHPHPSSLQRANIRCGCRLFLIFFNSFCISNPLSPFLHIVSGHSVGRVVAWAPPASAIQPRFLGLANRDLNRSSQTPEHNAFTGVQPAVGGGAE